MTPRRSKSGKRGRKTGWGNLPLTHPVALPGDKSISHRALILAALGEGRSEISGLNAGADVVATARCLERLGASVKLDLETHKAIVEGQGSVGLHEPEGVLDAGNSGTTLRTLLGLCARLSGTSFLTGDESLCRRPMSRVVDPLRRMGAEIRGRRDGDLAPLMVTGGRLRGISYRAPIASAQVKTSLLLAGLGAEGPTSVTEPTLSRDHTERMLAALGADVSVNDLTVSVTGPQELPARDWNVPADPSAAIFFVVAALLVPGSDLTLSNVALNPTRTAAFDVLRQMGAAIDVVPTADEGGEPIGDVTARESQLRGVRIDPAVVPWLIDEIPILAVAASQAEGVTSIEGAGELRVKESDRLATMATGLRTLGVPIEETDDGLRIEGPTPLGEGDVDSFGDHRVAMSFAIAALVARTDIKIRGWSSVDTSFPDFISTLSRARGLRR